MPPLNRRSTLLAAPLLGLLPKPAPAQHTRPLRFVVPFPPGGSLDIMTRLIAQPISATLGQQIIIDNRPGGGTVIGTDAVAKAPADGHTVLVMANSFTINAALVRNPPFDARRDFTAVASIGFNPHALVVTPSLAARDTTELAALARATPGGLTYASFGQGTSAHLGGESLRIATGAPLTHVPYRGAVPALQDVAAGRVAMMFSNLLDVIPLVRDGRLRALGLADTARHPQFPDTPTFIEQGFPGVVSNSWFAMVARSESPAPLLDALNTATTAAIQDPAMRARFEEMGISPRAMDRATLARFLTEEFDRNARIVRDSNITLEG